MVELVYIINMKIILDTNFLLIPGKFKVDVFSELERFGKPELFTLDLVVSELEKLSKGRGKDAGNAKLGLELVKKNKVKTIKSSGKNTDSEIERLAAEEDYIVCTQDRELIEKLKREGIQIIHLRQKRYLEYVTRKR